MEKTLKQLVKGRYIKVKQYPRTYARIEGNRIAIYEATKEFQVFNRVYDGDKKYIPETIGEWGLE